VGTDFDERVLVLMPTARDGGRAERALAAAGLTCAVCRDMDDLCREIGRGAGAALLTEEAFEADRDGRLVRALQDQPPWSDFPLVVLARQGAEVRQGGVREALNATLVERPVKVRSLLSVVRAGLRSRRHQYAVRDHLTERRRAEQDLVRVTAGSERQRRMFETALSNVTDFVYLFDLDGRLTYANKALLDLLRKAPAEAVGKTFAELDYPPDLADRLRSQLRQVIETRRAIRDEAPYTSAAGTRAYEYIFVPVFGEDGCVEAVAGSTRDITERKEMEEALRASEARYRVLVTASADVVYRMSPDWAEMYPLDGRALVASNAEPIRGWMQKNLPAFEHPRVTAVIDRAVADKRPFELEHQVFRPDGSFGWTHSRAAPILDPRGEIVEWFGTARDVTDRKRADGELARLAEALGLALAAADLGTWEWDPVTDAIALSARAAEIYAVDPAGTHRREALRGLIHPDDRTRARAAAERAAAERADYDVEYRLIRPGGEPVWVAARGRGAYDAGGKLTRMHGVVQDVSARKRAEHELRDIRSRMEAALAAGAIGTWSWDVPGDRFFGDPSLARIFGLEPTAVTGGALAGLIAAIHPDDRDRVSDRITRAVQAGGWYEDDYRVARRDGSWRWVTARGQVERDAHGRAVRFPGVVVDVTERKNAEDALKRVTAESERRKRLYETVLSNTPDLVYVFDLDHRFVYANDALLATWGRAWEQAVGRTCLELGYEPWHAARHDREIEQVRATKQPIRGEVPFTGTGGRRIGDYIFAPVFAANGEVEAVAGTTRDVTARKEMEDELRESDRKKDEFIALLAHELRNPLAPLRNGLQILRLSDGDARSTGRAREMMDRQLNHMVRLIDDLLDVSRIGRNKMELRRQPVALSEVVSSAVETVRPAIDAAGHELTVSLPARPVLLEADLTRLSQVFSNLLTNSAKYTEPGGKIWLSAEARDGAAVVSVRDTGTGIPPAALPTIFDMFSQVDRTIERRAGGLGIGLALVKGLVEMHGGSVSAHSEGQGRGSTFTVTLPTLTHGPAPAPAFGTDDDRSSSGPGKKILVVDDNRDGAESLAEMLLLLGNEVHVAHDGLEAVTWAERLRPAVILMDVGMPRLNGLDATRRIREHEWGKSIAIIALTGWGQENDRARSRAAGCDGHLVKPVGLADLAKLLRELAGANGD
jgi:PAS domain S-box-containing protein